MGAGWKLAEWMGPLLFSISCYFQHSRLPAEAEEQLAVRDSSVFVISNLLKDPQYFRSCSGSVTGSTCAFHQVSYRRKIMLLGALIQVYYTFLVLQTHYIYICINIYCPCTIQQPLRQWHSEVVHLLLLRREQTLPEVGELLAKITQKAHLALS